ncbi:flagellar hook-associated protein FlgL [Cognatilysobacter bugurensis]|uniref:Flagellar hook-associated protein FlgL n=1 Tax=Cognatilysobacter bugurensis TaxID=543356 RepID=A0A918T351_9GAMM|nr:flagellar hook-associated protein FlgL [Lysobacter bugurensis]GHA89386.1 flagellar hook-associated protein FlgL [Lysobacter bugurensis]
MTLRISTAALHSQGLQGLLKRQSDVARTQQEMVTGNKLTRAAQDPSGAAQAQRIDHAVAMLDGFERNASLLQSRLEQQESALSDSGDLLGRARDLAVQANNASLSSADRRMVALEIRHLRSELLSVSNRDDGTGRALFAGRVDGVRPFVESGGTVSYAGDDGRNMLDVGPDLALADAEPGSDVFMRVRTGDGTVRGTPASTNAGNVLMQGAQVVNFGTWAGAPMRIEFTAPDAYRIVDSGGAVLSTGAYTSGESITFGGVQTRLNGTPAVGDSFTVEPAPTRDVFATLEQLADALDMPVASDAERARQNNLIGGALGDISTAQNHVLGLRAGTGARLGAIDEAGHQREAQNESLRTNLSDLRDVNYAEATSRLSLQLTAIEAAQRTMLRVQQLSLFDRLG